MTSSSSETSTGRWSRRVRCWCEFTPPQLGSVTGSCPEVCPYLARPGYGLLKPKHTVAGFEVAGHVEAVGRNVRQFHSGDEVFGWCSGALAEYMAMSEYALALKPANLTVRQAADVLVGP